MPGLPWLSAQGLPTCCPEFSHAAVLRYGHSRPAAIHGTGSATSRNIAKGLRRNEQTPNDSVAKYSKVVHSIFAKKTAAKSLVTAP